MLLDVLLSHLLVGLKIRVLLVLLHGGAILLRVLLGFGEEMVVSLGEGPVLGQEAQGITEGKGLTLLGRPQFLILKTSELFMNQGIVGGSFFDP
jgi:hypothetical protein